MNGNLEIWKDIPGFEGFYQVSNLARVRSMPRVIEYKNRYGGITGHPFEGKILKPNHDTYGYETVQLKKNGTRVPVSVHRLVADAFCHKPDGCNVVNHLDYNILNNLPSNLEWTTQSGNVQWSKHRLRAGHKPSSATGEKYICMRQRKTHPVYIVHIRWLGVYKEFKSLEDAKKYKAQVMATNEK